MTRFFHLNVCLLLTLLVVSAQADDRADPGPHQVLVVEGEWKDDDREGRSVLWKCYLPADLKIPAPVVLFSHGAGGSRQTNGMLGRHLASHGFAALRADEKLRVPPVVHFLVAAFVSVVGGLASGFEIWILAGYSPDNSGGTLIFVFGSCIMSLLSIVLGLFWKNTAVFYGLNSFTFLTVFMLILSVRITKTA